MAEEDPPGGPARRVLRDLRAARRRRRIADFDPFEALYRAYVTGIVLGVAVLVLSSVIGDTRVAAPEVARIHRHGAAFVGLAVALAWAVGLRSGGRGGPLVVEAADVRHVLLSPVDRAVALRGPAIRQLRFLLLVGAGAGGVAGLLALRRLPGPGAGWVAAGAAVGALAVAGAFGLAMLVSGLRLGRWVGGILALLVLGWSAADAAAGVTTSPASLLGGLALWPLRVRPVEVVGGLVALAALPAGLAVIGRSSLEASERRAGLIGQIRFAATLQDLRTVIVLRRQLAQELPRQRPWVRLRRSIPARWLAPGAPLDGAAHRRRFPVWRRSWHGIMRWPALRFARVLVLGAVAGAALVGVWRGTTPLVVVAGLALYVAGLDAIEPLAEEVDHPDRVAGYVLPQGNLYLRQLAAPAVLMVVVGGAGLLCAAALTAGATLTWELGGLIAVPASLGGLAAATVSVVKGPPPPFSSQTALMPEAAGARAMGRLLWPPIIATLGAAPLLGGRDAAQHHHDALAATVPLVQLVVVLLVGVALWVRWQEEAHAWFDQQMALSGAGGTGRGPAAPAPPG